MIESMMRSVRWVAFQHMPDSSLKIVGSNEKENIVEDLRMTGELMCVEPKDNEKLRVWQRQEGEAHYEATKEEALLDYTLGHEGHSK